MPDIHRLGQIAYFEQQLESVEAQLKSLAESVTDRLFAWNSHLNTDGEEAVVLVKRYAELQKQGIEMRKKLEALKPE